MPPLTIRAATCADLPALHALIQRAYRGDSARGGWTHEADLLSGERIGLHELTAMVEEVDGRLLVALREDEPIGCVRVAKVDDGLGYLGLLCVDPALQTGGIGKRLIDAAERTARTTFGASRMEMTVIDRRHELIAYYQRRGYAPAGTRAFPVPLDPPLGMVVLERAL